MKKIFYLSSLAIALSCGSDRNESIDQEKPVIVSNYAENFPQTCSTIKRGETLIFKAKFTDNVELGSYNIDIHNNFDHHNHDSEVSTCEMDAKKTPTEKAFVYNQTFDIPTGRNSVEVTQSISIPSDVDTGDYHFMIKVTDKSGWSINKGISIKIVE